jgi:hypothetical protein
MKPISMSALLDKLIILFHTRKTLQAALEKLDNEELQFLSKYCISEMEKRGL